MDSIGYFHLAHSASNHSTTWTQPSRVQRPKKPRPPCRLRFLIALIITLVIAL